MILNEESTKDERTENLKHYLLILLLSLLVIIIVSVISIFFYNYGYNKNGVECVIENSLPSNEKDCFANLVIVTKSDLNIGYVISEGEYYNELSCITRMYRNAKDNDYIVPKDYELDENSCLKMP